jgi:hypothetical protein
MIDSHQLIKSAMNMLVKGVGACSGARGILSTITTKRGEDRSVTSKSVRLSFTAATATENNEGDSLAQHYGSCSVSSQIHRPSNKKESADIMMQSHMSLDVSEQRNINTSLNSHPFNLALMKL